MKFAIALWLLCASIMQAQTVADSQRSAIKKYPQLAVAGSDLNKRFVAAVQERKQNTPKFFESPDWPMKLADELSGSPIIPGLNPGGEVAPSAAKGRIDGTITIAGKPMVPVGDIEAMLVPVGTAFERKLTLPYELPMRAMFKDTDKSNCFYEKADSAGRVSIADVPPGEYYLIAITREMNVTRSGAAASRLIMSPYLNSQGLDLQQNYQIKQVHVVISPDEKKEISINFE